MNKKTTNNLPVSRKFYESIRERVRSVVNEVVMCEDTDIIDQIMTYIDDYLKAPGEDLDFQVRQYNECEIIFLTLRGEIDRAIERSRRARTRAASRRTTLEVEKPQVSLSEDPTVAKSKEVPTDKAAYTEIPTVKTVSGNHAHTTMVVNNPHVSKLKNRSGSGIRRE
ncbi:MAG: hypothetical protein K2K72_07135 [Duncaniella sp.]|nr:hypothetical protein [Duncaniella sp.]